MENSRRRFLQIAGVSALGLGATPVLNAFAASGADKLSYQLSRNDKAASAKKWAMVIDTRKLTTHASVQPLIDACHTIHNIPTEIQDKNQEIKWIWETRYENAFTDEVHPFLDEAVAQRPFLLLCNQCEKPPCVRACPTQATFQNKEGIVMMDFHRCIGCRFCMAACPFGARSFNFRDPRPFIKKTNTAFPTRMKGVVEKCNFCAERLAVGKMPACAEASNGAIAFGDLYDPDSTVRKLLKENYTIRRKQTLGTEPSVYYIV